MRLRKIYTVMVFCCISMLLFACSCGAKQVNQDSSATVEPELNKETLPTEEADSNQIDICFQEPSMSEDQTSKELSQKILETIYNLPSTDFESAVPYEDHTQPLAEEDHLVLLAGNEDGNARIYGYQSHAYGSRGMIVNYNGINSYFDYAWNPTTGENKLYEQDFDHDGKTEICFCFQGPIGTGVNMERLLIFDCSDEDGVLFSYEFTSERQLDEIKKILDFNLDLNRKQLILSSNKQIVKCLDWNNYKESFDQKTIIIDCLNQVHYTIQDHEILMYVDFGIWLSTGGPPIFSKNNEGRVPFCVKYEDGTFKLDLS